MVSLLKKLRRARRPKCAALVVAAGSSRRMGGANKLLLDLDGAPVLARTLCSLQLADRVDEIVVATREADISAIADLCRQYGVTKCTKVVAGGRDRVESALKAAMGVRRGTVLLAVHDGARPLVTPELVNRVIAEAARTGAAAPAVPVKDTVKRMREDGTVAETLDRAELRAVQTPQVFQADVLKAALKAALDGRFPATDDCSAVERLGKVVWLVEGEEENLKITTPLDMALARAILERRKAEARRETGNPAEPSGEAEELPGETEEFPREAEELPGEAEAESDCGGNQSSPVPETERPAETAEAAKEVPTKEKPAKKESAKEKSVNEKTTEGPTKAKPAKEEAP